jgi:hypothetical protein
MRISVSSLEEELLIREKQVRKLMGRKLHNETTQITKFVKDFPNVPEDATEVLPIRRAQLSSPKEAQRIRARLFFAVAQLRHIELAKEIEDRDYEYLDCLDQLTFRVEPNQDQETAQLIMTYVPPINFI